MLLVLGRWQNGYLSPQLQRAFCQIEYIRFCNVWGLLDQDQQGSLKWPQLRDTNATQLLFNWKADPSPVWAI